MAISLIQYPLLVSRENVNLDKAKSKDLINFKFKFQNVLFYTLLAIFSIITKYPIVNVIINTYPPVSGGEHFIEQTVTDTLI